MSSRYKGDNNTFLVSAKIPNMKEITPSVPTIRAILVAVMAMLTTKMTIDKYLDFELLQMSKWKIKKKIHESKCETHI